jgi:predicted component of type VI protein secretion system
MTAHLETSDGRRIEVRDGVTLGRAPQCDVVLEDTKASRQHARLVVTGSVVEIEDLESSNGTLLNGTPVRRRLLRDGDRIQIGTTTLRFVQGHGAPISPPPVSDDPYRPGGGLEGDPFAARDPAPPETAPRETAPPATAPPQSPAPAEVDVIEFVDEVVEVVRRPPKSPAPSPPSAAKPPAAAARTGGVARQHGVLRFSKEPKSTGPLGDDLRQMSSVRRALVVLLCLLAAVALGYGAMRLVALG